MDAQTFLQKLKKFRKLWCVYMD